MRKIFLLLLFFLLILNKFCFSYFSKFLNPIKNTLEYTLLTNPDGFSLKIAGLIASGVNSNNFNIYLGKIEKFKTDISNSVTNDNIISNAYIIFENMHKYFLKNYNYSSTTLDVVLLTGKYNCLSSTLLYNILLEEFGIKANAVALPTHIYTRLIYNNIEIDIENTTPNGFDIGNKPEVQENFKKYTGFTYIKDSDKAELIDNKGIIGYNYANISYFADKQNLLEHSFLSSLKSIAIYPNGLHIYSNVIASANKYALYLCDNKKDYELALDILEEGILNIKDNYLYKTNYIYVFDKYLNSIINQSQYDYAFQKYNKFTELLGENKGILENLISRILYKVIIKEKDFVNGFGYIINLSNKISDSPNLKSIIINGFNLLSEEILYQWKNYEKYDKLFINWYNLLKDKNMDIILENFYSDLGIKFMSIGNIDKGIDLINNGLKILPSSKVLSNNGAYIASKYSLEKYNKNDYENSLKYMIIAYKYLPNDDSIVQNLNVISKNYIEILITQEEYKKALDITIELLKIFKDDKKLINYKNQLEKRVK